MNITQVSSHLYLIPLDQAIPGFTSFISSWLYTDSKKTFLVDVGPAATVPILVNALRSLNVTHMDAILLTHIHIDHAGGIKELSDAYPNTPIICHGSAIPHLIDPTRLWEGSLKTLGDTAKAYGPIQAVLPSLLKDAAQVSVPGVTIIPTPGHAPHHISFLIDTVLFAGEASGVSFDIPGADRKYLRPATPPKFHLQTSLQSIDRLLETEHSTLCFGHFGATTDTPNILKTHRNQLLLWNDIIQEMKTHQPNLSVDLVRQELLKKDSLLSGWYHMDTLTRNREMGFMNNSIRGFLG